ncbi:MAG TPA: Uma2 family endonuclease [Pirellulaceae bacterium]|nr:Uma2 family endonuclease [Pirellulaceae bacterium]
MIQRLDRPATIADLQKVPEKAELVKGAIVIMSPASAGHGRKAGRIYQSLLEYEERTGKGIALPDNVGFIVDLPNRQSFSPDAAYFLGPYHENEFIDGAPAFAAEVRSPEDFGPAAEREMADKRADYFAAGTQVVWDVDMIRDKVVRVYRADTPDQPVIYGTADIAEAEPILPGWRLLVAELLK